ncbi:MAG: NAD-dependent epimerase/dehydratase family protein [Ferruginibacter sp.]
MIEQLLAAGEKPVALFNKTPLPDFSIPGVIPVQCDILDVYALEEVMKDVTQIYHCAGLVSFSPKEEKQLYKINVGGTANMVNAALHAGVGRFVHVSSVAALGRLRQGEAVNESMHWTPETSNSKYGYSKFLGEMEVWRGIAEGLNAVIVNPVIILGPGDWNDSSTKIFKSVYDGFPWYSEGSSGFVDVRDAAAAMIALMKSDINAERFIVSAENLTYHTLFNMIAKAFGKKAPHKKVTPFLAALTRRLEAMKSRFTGASPLLTKETTATAFAKVLYDNSKLLSFLPDFQYRSMEDTISETCKALQQKLNN